MVEEAPARTLLTDAAHPYSRALAAAMPGRNGRPLEGELPSPLAPPSGCPFHPRCPEARPLCRESLPQWKTLAPGWRVRCHRA